jgi:hypothetical protein
MPPPASKRRTSSTSFDRIEGEGPKSFTAFRAYRDMGPDRTIDDVRKSLGRDTGYERLLYKWSSEFNWVERARAWDNMLEHKAREYAEGFIPVWEQRRQAALEAMWVFSEKLMARAEAMLSHPIVKEVTMESEDGRTHYTIVRPCGWSWSSVATVVKTAAELQAAVIAEGLLSSDDEAFDVETATADDLRAFIARAKARPRTRGAAT